MTSTQPFTLAPTYVTNIFPEPSDVNLEPPDVSSERSDVSLPPSENGLRARELAEKQKQTMRATADLVVAAVFGELENRPAVPDGTVQRVVLNSAILSDYQQRKAHAVAARYGIGPYIENEQALALLRETVKAALRDAFGTVDLQPYRSSLLVDVSIGVPPEAATAQRPSTALTTASANTGLRAALTAQIATRRDTVATRRKYFADLAKSPAMKAVFKLCDEHHGKRQLIYVSYESGDVFVSPSGKAVSRSNREISDNTLLELNMDQIAKKVEQIYSNAAEGKLPTSYAAPLWYRILNIWR